jgi:ElaB/YqjD/DUF883 family membrane-anchored ribosome-binding protein
MELNVSKNGTATPADQLREIVGKAEELLGTLDDGVDGAAAGLRHRVKATIRNAKSRMTDLQSQASDMAEGTIRSGDAYVRGNPWTAVAVATAVGALIGAYVSRRR